MEQIVRCESTETPGLLLPGSIRGEPVQFLFATKTAWGCDLYESYVEDRGLPVSLTPEGRRRARVGELSACGRTWDLGDMPFSGKWRGRSLPVAGLIGSYLLHDSVVAIDASVPALACAPVSSSLSLDRPLQRLKFLDKTWKGTCYTDAIPGAVFGVAYEEWTTVTGAFLATQRKRPGPDKKAHVNLRLSDDITVTQRVEVVDSLPAGAVANAGITRVDGILGADLWCRWITVFDFPAGELLLFSYD